MTVARDRKEGVVAGHNMDIELIDIDRRKARFVARDISPAFANGLRRAVLADVPTLAIDTADIYENTSVMFDEVMSLRLGLVPLTTDFESYNLPEECTCEGEGCTNCEVVLTLDVEAEDEDVTVYSGDLESEDPEVQPADENIPLIELKPGQAVQAECVARLGKGKNHSKNQAGVAVGYRQLRRVMTDADDEYEDEILRGIVQSPDGDLLDMSEYDNRVDEAFDDPIAVEDIDDAFVFHVESDGSYSVDDLVVCAAESISSRAEELGEKVAP